jgi:hypothetical protein
MVLETPREELGGCTKNEGAASVERGVKELSSDAHHDLRLVTGSGLFLGISKVDMLSYCDLIKNEMSEAL